MLKYLGILALFLAAVIPAVEYGRQHKRRMREYAFFIRLCDRIHEEISGYLRPISDFLSDFFDSESRNFGLTELDCSKFISDISAACGALSVSVGAREAIASFFSFLGTSPRDVELGRVAALKKTLEAEMECEGRDGEKNARSVGAVCCALGLTLVILLI